MDHRDPPAPAPTAPWSKMLRRTALLLAIWFVAGPVLGILLVEPLNEFSLGGIPLGFWISQQGSIYVFILLIFAYAIIGDRADRDAQSRGTRGGGSAGTGGSGSSAGGSARGPG